MIVELDMRSDIPIYIQIRDQIIKGIGAGMLKDGDALPTVRSLANDIGVNPMTVNKAYALLKQEGVIIADRRLGVKICLNADATEYTVKLKKQLQLLISEAMVYGIEEQQFLDICKEYYQTIRRKQKEGTIQTIPAVE